MTNNTHKQTVLVGRIKTLQQISRYCRKVYMSAFPPEVAEEKLQNLTLVAAIDLWKAGLPHSSKL